MPAWMKMEGNHKELPPLQISSSNSAMPKIVALHLLESILRFHYWICIHRMQ